MRLLLTRVGSFRKCRSRASRTSARWSGVTSVGPDLSPVAERPGSAAGVQPVRSSPLFGRRRELMPIRTAASASRRVASAR